MTNVIVFTTTGELQIGSGKAFFIQDGVKPQVLILYAMTVYLRVSYQSCNHGQVLYSKIVSKLFLYMCTIYYTVQAK